MQFAPYRLPRRQTVLVVDIQSALLDELRTRVVIPLVRCDRAPASLLEILTPRLQIEDREYILLPQIMASIPVSELAQAAGTVIDHRGAIIRATDTANTVCEINACWTRAGRFVGRTVASPPASSDRIMYIMLNHGSAQKCRSVCRQRSSASTVSIWPTAS